MFSPGRRGDTSSDERARRTRARRLAAALTLGVTSLFVVRSLTLGVPGISGDEPHYLIMAESLLRDGDLELRAQYERDAQTYEIYGPMSPHVYNTPGGWMPYHTPGLAFLLALPFSLADVEGARLTLCVLTFVLPWALYLWLSTLVSHRLATWVTAGITLSLPVAYGASFIFPDLPGGIAVTGLVLFLLRAHQSGAPPASWAAFWLATGAIVWLNVKFAAPAMVLGVGGLVVAMSRRPDLAGRRGRMGLALLVAVGPLALIGLYQHLFGTPFGLRGFAEISSPPRRALAIFLGLHFDQSQGMFLQHPLMLAGLAALVPFVRTRPWLALFWFAVYGSLLVPNAMQTARFGSGGPAGRFGWTAVWLWAIPLGVTLNRHRHALERYVVPGVVLALLWQTALAIRWAWFPDTINGPVFDERIWARDSLFPVPLRYSFPSFYMWDFASYVAYPPTALALVGAGLLLVTGALASVAASRRWLASTWIAFGVVAAVLLPVPPPTGDASLEELARDRAVLRDATSQSTRRFEAERLFDLEHTPNVAEDDSASGGEALAVQGAAEPAALVSGSPVAAAAGDYRVEVVLRLAAPTSSDSQAAQLEVTRDGRERPLAGGAIFSKELSVDGYARVRFHLTLTEPHDALRFRLSAAPGVGLLVDYVDVVPLLPARTPG